MLPDVLRLKPQYRDYVWGGERLRPGQLTAEAWIVHENDVVEGGTLEGKTLAELTSEFGSALLGSRVIERRGPRFPVLIKLLDCNQWLSLQVHPNDEQAVRLEGAGQNGKTEAWHILDASSNAQIIAGLIPGVEMDDFEKATRQGTISSMANYMKVNAGDTVLMRAGTIHALGPGLLVYEVQETSDITYRVFDWNRPQTNGRVLHIDKSLAVANPFASSRPSHLPPAKDSDCLTLCTTEYFTLQYLNSHQYPLEMDTHGQTFHALTVIDGLAHFSSGKESVSLGKFKTILVPAATGAYHLEPETEGFKILCSSL